MHLRQVRSGNREERGCPSRSVSEAKLCWKNVSLLVREALQDAGYATVVAHVDDLKRGRIDLVEFVEQHHPDVIVYDVAPPYDTNWTFLRLMRSSKVMQGRAFVVTTTNKKALDELIGPSDTVELLCKPYDLEQIVQAVTHALSAQTAAATA